MNANFEKLAQREGGYSLPYLVHLYDKNGTDALFSEKNAKKKHWFAKSKPVLFAEPALVIL